MSLTLLGRCLEYLWPLDSWWTGPLGLRLIGTIVFVVGAAIAGWRLLTFRKAQTTVPGERSSQLVTWGPFGKQVQF
jgi:protein-S-isoprenylcysteine O-methyltransferase Ste14